MKNRIKKYIYEDQYKKCMKETHKILKNYPPNISYRFKLGFTHAVFHKVINVEKDTSFFQEIGLDKSDPEYYNGYVAGTRGYKL